MDLDQLTKDLMSDEGAVKDHGRHIVYKDHLGNDTIGYGRLLSRGLSQDEAVALLLNDIRNGIDEMDRHIPWWRDLPEPAMRGLANMVYQLGWTRFRGFRRMLGHLEAGDRGKAAQEALNSLWARQTPERAQRVAAMIRGRG